eukprot:763680-Hanusia_phi.AAC.1
MTVGVTAGDVVMVEQSDMIPYAYDFAHVKIARDAPPGVHWQYSLVERKPVLDLTIITHPNNRRILVTGHHRAEGVVPRRHRCTRGAVQVRHPRKINTGLQLRVERVEGVRVVGDGQASSGVVEGEVVLVDVELGEGVVVDAEVVDYTIESSMGATSVRTLANVPIPS